MNLVYTLFLQYYARSLYTSRLPNDIRIKFWTRMGLYDLFEKYSNPSLTMDQTELIDFYHEYIVGSKNWEKK